MLYISTKAKTIMKRRKLKLIYRALNNQNRQNIINLLFIHNYTMKQLSYIAVLRLIDVDNHINVLKRIKVIQPIYKKEYNPKYKINKIRYYYYKFILFIYKYTIKGAELNIGEFNNKLRW